MKGPRLALAALLAALGGCSNDGPGDAGDTVPDTTVLAPDIVLFPDTATLADTASPPDTSPPADTDLPPADAATCSPGSACDDGDPCTVNDQCVDGGCRGTALQCDDQIPCTADACVGGQCQHTVQPGFCLIGGTCWTDQQANPNNACQRCVATQSTAGWANADGLACDDGDPCTEGESCQGGACRGGTTLQTPACGGPAPCTYHGDCYPERVCGRWNAIGALRCSDPCAGPAHCGQGQICTKVPGSTQMGYCQDAVAGLPNGSPCSDDSQCTSRLCTGFCENLCLNQQTCAQAGHSCHPVGDLAAGYVTAACSPNPPGALGNGSPCRTPGGDFDASLCATGHCDLLANTPTCTTLCKSESDCAPWQECNFVIASPFQNANTVPFLAIFTQPTHDTVAGCYTPPGGVGGSPVGSVCTSPQQCSSNKCLALSPDTPTQFCTSFCASDADCPATMRCKQDVSNLVSAWLLASGAATTGAFTFVRLCKLP